MVVEHDLPFGKGCFPRNGWAPSRTEASTLSSTDPDGNGHTPRTTHEECLRSCPPSKSDGRIHVDAVQAFDASPDVYFSLQNAPEAPQFLVAESNLKGSHNHSGYILLVVLLLVAQRERMEAF